MPPSVDACDLRISNGAIVERAKRIAPRVGDDVHDLHGRIVMPGLVCAHTHLYSALSRGMPAPRTMPVDFPGILNEIWWKLDRALDEDSIYYSALAGAIDAVMCGTTTIVDHHASPEAIPGSLDVIKQALETVGLRGVLCYEVTDRGGQAKRDEGLAENGRFIRANQNNEMFRGLVGAHASFTLCDESMARIGRMAADLGTGVHIHAGEDGTDIADAQKKYHSGLMERFTRHGIARRGSILAHCVHLTPAEIEDARRAGCMLVHNPRSNVNNRVGYAPVHLFGDRGALGTDGFPADMFSEAGFGFYKNQDAQAVSGREAAADMIGLLDGGQRMLAELFGRRFGAIEQGAAADLIVLDYQPPTPLAAENCAGHVLFGMRSSMVESVMAGGRFIMKDRVIAGIDTAVVAERSRAEANQMWERMQQIR
jgi:putative selenium metabolism protein SsnA